MRPHKVSEFNSYVYFIKTCNEMIALWWALQLRSGQAKSNQANTT